MFPADRWELTAPESYLLLESRRRPAESRMQAMDRDGARGLRAFELALKELVLCSTLDSEPAWTRRWAPPGWRPEWLVSAGPESVDAPALTAALARIDRCRIRRGWSFGSPRMVVEGVTVSDLQHRLTRGWRGSRTYVADIEAALRAQSLLGSGKRPTVRGHQATRLLRAWIAAGERSLVRRRVGPDLVALYLAGAGAAALLLSDSSWLSRVGALPRHDRFHWTDGNPMTMSMLDWSFGDAGGDFSGGGLGDGGA